MLKNRYYQKNQADLLHDDAVRLYIAVGNRGNRNDFRKHKMGTGKKSAEHGRSELHI